MFNATLFLGVPVTDSLQDALDRVNPQLVETFVNGGDNYLMRTQIGDAFYLGKNLGGLTDTARVRLFKDNILSLLSRLVPNHSLDEESLVLLSKVEAVVD